MFLYLLLAAVKVCSWKERHWPSGGTQARAGPHGPCWPLPLRHEQVQMACLCKCDLWSNWGDDFDDDSVSVYEKHLCKQKNPLIVLSFISNGMFWLLPKKKVNHLNSLWSLEISTTSRLVSPASQRCCYFPSLSSVWITTLWNHPATLPSFFFPLLSRGGSLHHDSPRVHGVWSSSLGIKAQESVWESQTFFEMTLLWRLIILFFSFFFFLLVSLLLPDSWLGLITTSRGSNPCSLKRSLQNDLRRPSRRWRVSDASGVILTFLYNGSFTGTSG